ncbi:MAG: phosphate acyltransferase PlsX [Lactobacillaceae bacterium]|jgi:glycerol-3-phosphate acyltransferase PlsX|nr:phosphate acyltransferase PlsX [Lactobacillaceae bacterium]
MTKNKFTIAIDAMGGDFAPKEIVKGTIAAAKKFPELNFKLYGQSEKVIEFLTDDLSNIEVIDAREIIEMGEEPVKAMRTKKDSSLVRAATDVKNGNADALFSAGNTGALLSSAIFIIGRIKGVLRPALLTTLPSVKQPDKQWVLMDVGANAESKSIYLYQFGILANFYAEKILKYKKPIVKLLNNGSEEDKGDQVHKEAYQLLKKSLLNFQGNIEARELLEGQADIVVADGFSGNAALKATEGTALAIFSSLSRVIKNGNFKTKIGGLLLKPALKEFAKVLDYNNAGGAVILGVNAPVVKTHGSAKSIAVTNTIAQLKEMLDTNLVKDVTKYVEKHEEEFNVKVEDNGRN